MLSAKAAQRPSEAAGAHNLRILGLLDAWKLHFQHLTRETNFAYIGRRKEN